MVSGQGFFNFKRLLLILGFTSVPHCSFADEDVFYNLDGNVTALNFEGDSSSTPPENNNSNSGTSQGEDPSLEACGDSTAIKAADGTLVACYDTVSDS